MGVEIERKFLLANDSWRAQPKRASRIAQGYLSRDKNATVRIRLIEGSGILTVKGATVGLSRPEFEYAIPENEAVELLKMCSGPVLSKIRHLISVPGTNLKWEIDEFEGENAGLIVAEIELPSEDTQFERPAWLGEEVSHDHRYFNSQLVVSPYSLWANASGSF